MITRISSSYLVMARGRNRSLQARNEHGVDAMLGTITRLLRGRVIPLMPRKLLLKILLLLLLAVLPELACFGLPGPLSQLVTSKARRC